MNNQIGWIYNRNEREKQKERLQQLEQEKQHYLEKLPPLPRRSAPHPWEDLASLLSRVARKMGYERPEWLLRPENAPYKISPASLPRLHGQHDYHFLKRLLLLDEEQLYAMTLHRFAPRFIPQPRPLSAMNGEMQQPIKRAGLQYEYIRQFFSDERYSRVCPRCIDEGNGYDRLYWRCELLLYCPRHRVFLVNRCPDCHAPIPALRLSLTCRPVCQTGDYRTHIFPLLPEDGWLERVHITLLRNPGTCAHHPPQKSRHRWTGRRRANCAW